MIPIIMKYVHNVTIFYNVCLAIMLYYTYAHNILLLLPTLRRVLNTWNIEFSNICEAIRRIYVIESVHTDSVYTLLPYIVHFSLEFIKGHHFSNKISTQNITQRK